MAAVTRVKVALVTPTGEGVIARGYATEDFLAGDPVVIDGLPPSSLWDVAYGKAVAEQFVDGVAVKDCKAGGTVEVVEIGEMDGYSGLTPRASYTVASGALDTTAPAINIRPQFRAVSDTRIRVNI